MAPKPKLTDELRGKILARKHEKPEITQKELAAEFDLGRTAIRMALAASGVPADEPGTVTMLPLAALFPSPLNPRRTIDDEALRELAESIARDGLLQNLVVRPPINGSLHEIIAGERRYRALELLRVVGRWDAPVPCLVKDVDPATHMALALLENLQRQDVPPLEEAAAFAQLQALDPETWTAPAIAARINRTPRYVYQRLATHNNLIEPAKLLLRKGKLTIEGARLLAAEPPARQTKVLEEWDAVFTEETFDEGIEPATVDEIEQQLSWLRGQDEIAKRRAAADAAPEPGSAMRLDHTGGETDAGEDGEDDDAGADAETLAEAGAIERRIDAENAEHAPGPPVTKSHTYHAHRRKSLALQEEVAENPDMAMRLVCFAMLAPFSGVVMIQRRGFYSEACKDDDVGKSLPVEGRINKLLGGVKPPQYHGEEKVELKLWAKLMGLVGHDLQNLFSALVARQICTPAGYQCLLGDSPLAEAVAEALDIPSNEAQHGLSLIAEDLAGLRKPILLAIADETGTPGINDETKTKDLVEAIVKRRKKLDYVIPTLRFGSTKQIKKALKECGK